MPQLTANRVEEIYIACLFEDEELKEGDTVLERLPEHVMVEGIVNNTAFHPDRLAEHVDEILEMLLELPDDFKESKGGGKSFLNACNDKDGNQWTGLHMRMGQLFDLGVGIGKVEPVLSREYWSMMPGGVPYYMIKDQ